MPRDDSKELKNYSEYSNLLILCGFKFHTIIGQWDKLLKEHFDKSQNCAIRLPPKWRFSGPVFENRKFINCDISILMKKKSSLIHLSERIHSPPKKSSSSSFAFGRFLKARNGWKTKSHRSIRTSVIRAARRNRPTSRTEFGKSVGVNSNSASVKEIPCRAKKSERI